MSTRVKWYQWKNYSGFALAGTIPFDKPVNPSLHIDRAVWLAGQLEAPKWGSVQGYDGCGISGGILHHIAVARDGSQGSFWPLIRRVFDLLEVGSDPREGDHMAMQSIKNRMRGHDMQLAQDGKLRTLRGLLVSGRDIRSLLGDPNGVVPRRGHAADDAKWWVESFGGLLSFPRTFKAQSDYAALWLARGNSAAELAIYQRFSKMVRLDTMLTVPQLALPRPVELAMCVYHAFSVNAPAPAAQCLEKVASETDPHAFAKKLIRGLGTKKFGRWQDQPGDGASRYDKTRRAVVRSGLWDSALVADVMPVDL